MRFLKFWVPLLVYMAFMWGLSSRSIGYPRYAFPFSDKIFHFLEYSLFGFLLARVIQARQPKPRFKLFILVIIFALIWGAIDELHQSFVPLREASFFDLIADCLGAGVGQIFVTFNRHSAVP